jgi:hypothetical protein
LRRHRIINPATRLVIPTATERRAGIQKRAKILILAFKTNTPISIYLKSCLLFGLRRLLIEQIALLPFYDSKKAT